MERSGLLQRESIAGAVAREAERIAAGTQQAICEGAGYKAAWDRRGSDAMGHCDDAARDAARCESLVYHAELRAHDWASGAPAWALAEAARNLDACRVHAGASRAARSYGGTA